MTNEQYAAFLTLARRRGNLRLDDFVRDQQGRPYLNLRAEDSAGRIRYIPSESTFVALEACRRHPVVGV